MVPSAHKSHAPKMVIMVNSAILAQLILETAAHDFPWMDNPQKLLLPVERSDPI